MGFNEKHVYSSVRFSLCKFTAEEDINQAVSLITGAYRKLQAEKTT